MTICLAKLNEPSVEAAAAIESKSIIWPEGWRNGSELCTSVLMCRYFIDGIVGSAGCLDVPVSEETSRMQFRLLQHLRAVNKYIEGVIRAKKFVDSKRIQ